MRRLNSKFSTKFISEAGTKNINKDYFGFVTLDNYACWAIAESYDNDTEVISAQLAVETVLDLFTKKPTMSKRKIKNYIREAHNQLKEQSEKYQLKASILVVVTDYTKLMYALVGNCRLHIFRGNNPFIKSEDQTLYQQMIRDGQTPDDGVSGIEESRNLFYFLGKQGRIRIFASRKIKMHDEDIVLLTTWGFWEKITLIEMIDALENVKSAEDYVDELQDLYLSKQQGRVNNYTVSTIFINKVFVPKEKRKKLKRILAIILAFLIAVAIITIIYQVRKAIKRNEIINIISEKEKQGDSFFTDDSLDRAMVEYNQSIEQTKGLKDTKGKYGKENNIIKSRLSLKQKVTQLMIDGDKYLDEKKYSKAVENYKKVLKEAKGDMDFFENIDIDELESKIKLAEEFEYIDKLIDIGKSQADYEDYDRALATLEEAKNSAVNNRNKDLENDIRLQISEINLKKAELEKKNKEEEKAKEDEENKQEEEKAKEEEEKTQKTIEEKIKSGSLLELDGDAQLAAGNYAAAIDFYNQAVNIFKETDSLDKATAASKKIIEANVLIKEKDKENQKAVALGFIEIADAHIEKNNYKNALDNYILARDIYRQTDDNENVIETNKKIDSVKEKIKEADNTQKSLKGKTLEDEAEKLLKDQNYDEVLVKYREAQSVYQDSEQLDKVVSVEEKIKQVEELKKQKEESDLNKEKDEEEEIQKEKDKIQQEEEKTKAEEEKQKEEEKKEQEDKKKERENEAKKLELDGDLEASKGYYNRAENYYYDAIWIYKEIEEFEKASQISRKISDLNEKREEKEKEEKIKSASAYESLGDTYMSANKYDLAINNYFYAIDLYNEAGAYDKAITLNIKIELAREKQNAEAS